MERHANTKAISSSLIKLKYSYEAKNKPQTNFSKYVKWIFITDQTVRDVTDRPLFWRSSPEVLAAGSLSPHGSGPGPVRVQGPSWPDPTPPGCRVCPRRCWTSPSGTWPSQVGLTPPGTDPPPRPPLWPLTCVQGPMTAWPSAWTRGPPCWGQSPPCSGSWTGWPPAGPGPVWPAGPPPRWGGGGAPGGGAGPHDINVTCWLICTKLKLKVMKLILVTVLL